MKKVLFIMTIVLFGCAEDGRDGKNGSSCSVTQVSNGSIISCQDGTSAVILNGADGTNAAPTAYTVTEIIDPCGDKPGSFDEVLLRLANGQLMAHFSSGNLQFLTLLSPGNYQTTDAQKCNFSVDAQNNIIF